MTVLTAETAVSVPAAFADSLVQDTGLVRVRRCRYGLMAYITHDSYIGRSLDLYGEFSSGEAAIFAQLVRPGMWALDVGANIGAHTVRLAQLVGPQGRVVAFEPQRVIYQLMCANIGMNGLLNVEARQAAAGSEPGSLVVPPVNYLVAGNYGSLALGRYEEGEKVPLETIDELALPACHFIKMDIEGMETSAIRGARETIRRHRPLIYMENDRKEKSAELIELMFGQDYRLFWHLTPYFSPDNFAGNPEDVFPGVISINMLAVPREYPRAITGLPEVKSSTEVWTQFIKPRHG